MAISNTRVVLSRRHVGEAMSDCFSIETEELGELGTGQARVAVEYVLDSLGGEEWDDLRIVSRGQATFDDAPSLAMRARVGNSTDSRATTLRGHARDKLTNGAVFVPFQAPEVTIP